MLVHCCDGNSLGKCAYTKIHPLHQQRGMFARALNDTICWSSHALKQEDVCHDGGWRLHPQFDVFIDSLVIVYTAQLYMSKGFNSAKFAEKKKFKPKFKRE